MRTSSIPGRKSGLWNHGQSLAPASKELRQIKILSKKCHRKNPNLKPPKQTTEENYVTIFKNAPKAVYILNLSTGTFIHAFEEIKKINI